MPEVFAPGLLVTIEDRPLSPDVFTLEQGLFDFESARLGPPQHAQLAVFLRDAGGKVVGGVDGHLMWRRLFVKTMWIEAKLRGQGHGAGLLARVEKESLARICRGVWLTALGDRACGFYRKSGYIVVGEIADYVAAQSLYTLEKRFP